MTKRTARRRPPKVQIRRPRKKRASDSEGYWDVAHRPLQCFVFLLPMVLAYEVGMALTHRGIPIDARPDLAAKQLLQWFFSLFGIEGLYDLFGVRGLYLPGIALLVVLLVWQMASNYPWKVAWNALLGMAGESVLLALPVLLLNELIHDISPLQGVVKAGTSTFDNLLLSVGAGIYEELVFRLIVISLLTLLLIDIGRVKEVPGVALAVIISSLMFAAHHYPPVGSDIWSTSEFAFRFAAGGYLAAVFVLRGFGLAVGCHVIYDVIAFAIP
ncbi:MAG: CPBP family intramembrane glutamic endopeptidase [Planctomycetota bacterium]